MKTGNKIKFIKKSCINDVDCGIIHFALLTSKLKKHFKMIFERYSLRESVKEGDTK